MNNRRIWHLISERRPGGSQFDFLSFLHCDPYCPFDSFLGLQSVLIPISNNLPVSQSWSQRNYFAINFIASRISFNKTHSPNHSLISFHPVMSAFWYTSINRGWVGDVRKKHYTEREMMRRAYIAKQDVSSFEALANRKESEFEWWKECGTRL